MKQSEKRLVLMIHNVRSALNVGALFRTADGAGVERVILTGYTPVPALAGKKYLTPAEKSLTKTALGAEHSVPWKRYSSFSAAVRKLRVEGFEIAGLEQSEGSIDYREYRSRFPVALVVGNEPKGIDCRIVRQCDAVIEIPMRGMKNSLNVAVAAGIALFTIAGTIEGDNTQIK